MVKTKQTPPKSPGGPAQRVAIQQKHTGPKKPPPKKRKTAQPMCKPRKVQEPHSWCSNCSDGGHLTACEFCPRSFCQNCIPTDCTGDNVSDEDVRFVCPACFISPPPPMLALADAEGIKDRFGPGQAYTGIWRKGSEETRPLIFPGAKMHLGHWPIIHTGRLTIFSIRLNGMPLAGDPASVVYHNLVPYYGENVRLVSVEFDLVTGIHDYEAVIQREVRRLTDILDHQVLVLLTTHSTPDGDLHVQSGNNGASEVGAVLDALFPLKLSEVVKAARLSALVLLSCGSLHTLAQPREVVRQRSQRLGFSSIWGFSAIAFHPQAANKFLLDLSMSMFVHGTMSTFTKLLSDHRSLGVHTTLVVYVQGGVFEMFWAQDRSRPNGDSLPHQCSSCQALQRWDITRRDTETLERRCHHKACRDNAPIFLHQLPHSALHLTGQSHTPAGAWYGRWITPAPSKSPSELPKFLS
ncbi:hypothetical protein FB451DRAFT_1287198 [Mycena latifolia]|nr:hypothetical protein FB451DRAFT_1287198 [Mycena latifolia]